MPRWLLIGIVVVVLGCCLFSGGLVVLAAVNRPTQTPTSIAQRQPTRVQAASIPRATPTAHLIATMTPTPSPAPVSTATAVPVPTTASAPTDLPTATSVPLPPTAIPHPTATPAPTRVRPTLIPTLVPIHDIAGLNGDQWLALTLSQKAAAMRVYMAEGNNCGATVDQMVGALDKFYTTAPDHTATVGDAVYSILTLAGCPQS